MEPVIFNHLKVRRRILTFLVTKRKRLAMIVAFVGVFNFLGNSAAFMMSGAERVVKQNKRVWLSKNEHGVLAPPTAWDTQFQSCLPVKELEQLSEKFVELSRKYTYGLNHELLDKILKRPKVQLTPELYLQRAKGSVTLK